MSRAALQRFRPRVCDPDSWIDRRIAGPASPTPHRLAIVGPRASGRTSELIMRARERTEHASFLIPSDSDMIDEYARCGMLRHLTCIDDVDIPENRDLLARVLRDYPDVPMLVSALAPVAGFATFELRALTLLESVQTLSTRVFSWYFESTPVPLAMAARGFPGRLIAGARAAVRAARIDGVIDGAAIEAGAFVAAQVPERPEELAELRDLMVRRWPNAGSLVEPLRWTCNAYGWCLRGEDPNGTYFFWPEHQGIFDEDAPSWIALRSVLDYEKQKAAERKA